MFPFQPELDSDDFFRELNSTTPPPTACGSSDSDSDGKTLAYTVAINILIFITVSGVSSVVEFSEFKKSFKSRPIYYGAAFQFFLMPFIGFITVFIFPLDNLKAITLLILTASPGGSYSNWWCNLFNADLALSVSMTSLSTVASIGMLPLNIAIYITLAYQRTKGFQGEEIVIDYADLGLTLGVVISAILTGLYLGTTFPKLQSKFNFVGNIAGLTSIILGVFASADTCDGEAPWNQAFFPLWVATAFPLLFALAGTLVLGKLLGLKKPQRVAISLETAYQNTSISLAYALSQGEPGRRAAGIPVIYGGYEAGFFFIFMFASWKLGWTYAPPNTKFYRVLFETWQPGSPNHRATYPEYYLTEEKKEVIAEEKTSEEKSNNIVVEVAEDKTAERASATLVKEQKSGQHDGVSL